MFIFLFQNGMYEIEVQLQNLKQFRDVKEKSLTGGTSSMLHLGLSQMATARCSPGSPAYTLQIGFGFYTVNY